MDNGKKWLAPVLGFVGTVACIQTANVSDTLALSNSFFSVLLFLALTLLSGKMLSEIGFCEKKELGSSDSGSAAESVSGQANGAVRLRRDWIFAGLGALFMSVALGFGRQLDQKGSVAFLSPRLWIAIACMAAFLTPFLVWLFQGLDRLGEKLVRSADTSADAKGETARPAGGAAVRGEDSALRRICDRVLPFWRRQFSSPKKRFWLTAVGLFLCWTPVWLAAFPGFFAYDATDELTQVLTGEYVTRHPLLHVLLLGKTVAGFYELTGDWNVGIAVFEVFQMALMACIFSWLLVSLKKMGAPKIVLVLSFLFLGLFPTVAVFVLCTSKDTLYCAGMVSVLLLLCRLALNGRGQNVEKAADADGQQRGDVANVVEKQAKDAERPFAMKSIHWSGLCIALFAMGTFRNNGYYVFLVMIPVMLVLAGKKYWKKMAVCLICALLLIKGSNAALEAALSPQETGTQETLTVPIQQLARAYVYSPELFSEEEKETLFEILPEEVLERYNPKLSDMVKIDFQTANFEKDPGRYVQLWAKIGLRAPFTYVNAWLMTSYGFWYPDTIIDVYNGQRYYTRSSYFSFETEEPGYRDSKLPLLEKVYRKFSREILQEHIPVVSMLFSPGFLCWVYVLAGLYLVCRRRYRLAAAFGPVYLNWLTVLLGPTYLVRYVLIFWFALPLLIWMVLREKGIQE